MKNKIIYPLLAIMAISSFVGCSNKKNKTTSASSSVVSSIAPSSTPSSASVVSTISSNAASSVAETVETISVEYVSNISGTKIEFTKNGKFKFAISNDIASGANMRIDVTQDGTTGYIVSDKDGNELANLSNKTTASFQLTNSGTIYVEVEVTNFESAKSFTISCIHSFDTIGICQNCGYDQATNYIDGTSTYNVWAPENRGDIAFNINPQEDGYFAIENDSKSSLCVKAIYVFDGNDYTLVDDSSADVPTKCGSNLVCLTSGTQYRIILGNTFYGSTYTKVTFVKVKYQQQLHASPLSNGIKEHFVTVDETIPRYFNMDGVIVALFDLSLDEPFVKADAYLHVLDFSYNESTSTSVVMVLDGCNDGEGAFALNDTIKLYCQASGESVTGTITGIKIKKNASSNTASAFDYETAGANEYILTVSFQASANVDPIMLDAEDGYWVIKITISK